MKSKEFYKTRAWFYFSRFVLLNHSVNGVVQCSTCNTYKMINDKKMHLGHLIKVFDGNNTNFSVAFNEKNVMPQCSKCNVEMGGRQLLMLEAIEKKYGNGTYDKLKEIARKPIYGFTHEIECIKEEYQKKFNELVKIKGNWWK